MSKCLYCTNDTPEGMMICPNCEFEYKNYKKGEDNMVETIIKLETLNDVKCFCNLCSMCSGEVDVFSDRYVVSGKSIMGLFSLDLTKALKVEFHGYIPHEVRERMKNFIVD